MYIYINSKHQMTVAIPFKISEIGFANIAPNCCLSPTKQNKNNYSHINFNNFKRKTFLPHNLHGKMIKINDRSFAVFVERKVIKVRDENAIFIRGKRDNIQLRHTKSNSLGNFANSVCLLWKFTYFCATFSKC